MYCTVYTTGFGNVIYINPNCNMKLVYEYLRVATEVPDSKEIDLCTESGRLLGIYEAPCSTSGLDYFKPRANYFVLTFDYVQDSGELFNPKTLMHHKNHDFEAVFTRIKKVFMIPPTEPIDDNDAQLIFEHLLLAYQEKTDLFRDSVASNVKRSPEKKKRSQSSASVRGRSSKQLLESSVLAQWRAEKREKLTALRAEESEDSVMRRQSSFRPNIDNEYQIEEAVDVVEEAIPEEQLEEQVNLKKAKESRKRTSNTGGKKASKKPAKRTGKNGKEDAQLLQAAPNKSEISLASKPSGLLAYPVQQPRNSGSGDDLKTLRKSKSTLFANSEFKPTEPAQLPYDSIRQFFRDHPNDLPSLPKPPAVYWNSEVSEKLKNIKKKRHAAGSKKKKTVLTRPLHSKLRKRIL